jgi:hypothetical protein
MYFYGISNAAIHSAILFCPAGRKSTMSIQIRYVFHLLEFFPELISAYHIWDVAWSEEDSEYLKTLPLLHPKIKLLYTPYELGNRADDIASKQFAFIYSTFYQQEIFQNNILIKLDDDIVFMDVLLFPEFLRSRLYSRSFLLSANVINSNREKFREFDNIHLNFLNDYGDIVTVHRLQKTLIPVNCTERLSINFVAILGSDLQLINDEFSNKIGSEDEYRLCTEIACRENRDNEIDGRFTVVHYSFGGNTVDYGNSREYYITFYEQLADVIFNEVAEKVAIMKSTYEWEKLLTDFSWIVVRPGNITANSTNHETNTSHSELNSIDGDSRSNIEDSE